MHDFDLILKGGHVIDPSQDFNSQADIGLYNGKILKIEKRLNLNSAKKVIDVFRIFSSLYAKSINFEWPTSGTKLICLIPSCFNW